MQKDKQSKAKHFTTLEKKLFLDILKRYKHVIEVKKSDSTTLKDKEVAWSEICNEYNTSQLITQERTVQQLKKFWTNLKQTQRDALTREKQSRMATGGGPSIDPIEIDPDVATIAPNLMKSAPIIYSSNLDEKETERRKTQIMDYLDNNTDVTEIEFIENAIINEENNREEMLSDINNSISDKENIISDTSDITVDSILTSEKPLFLTKDSCRPQGSKEKSPLPKRRKCNTIHIKEDCVNETTLRKERIQKIAEQEMEINKIKIEHEKKVSVLKEQHLIKIHEQELRAATAATKIAELQLELQLKKNEKFLNP